MPKKKNKKKTDKTLLREVIGEKQFDEAQRTLKEMLDGFKKEVEKVKDSEEASSED